MPAPIAAPSSAWSYGGAILTFAFPMILFIAVAAALYVLYTKPHLVPGHRYRLDTGGAATAMASSAATASGTPPAAGEGAAADADHAQGPADTVGDTREAGETPASG